MKFFTFILFCTFSLLVACSSADNSTSENLQKNYQHDTVSDFETMQSCIDFVLLEAKNAGMGMKLTGLSSTKITGLFDGDEAMFFYCQKQKNGTGEILFEAVYPKFD